MRLGSDAYVLASRQPVDVTDPTTYPELVPRPATSDVSGTGTRRGHARHRLTSGWESPAARRVARRHVGLGAVGRQRRALPPGQPRLRDAGRRTADPRDREPVSPRGQVAARHAHREPAPSAAVGHGGPIGTCPRIILGERGRLASRSSDAECRAPPVTGIRWCREGQRWAQSSPCPQRACRCPRWRRPRRLHRHPARGARRRRHARHRRPARERGVRPLAVVAELLRRAGPRLPPAAHDRDRPLPHARRSSSGRAVAAVRRRGVLG